MEKKKLLPVVLVAPYRFQNFPVRTMHAVLESTDDVQVSTIFFKNCYTNTIIPPTQREEDLFADLIHRINPALVGLSVYSVYYGVAKRLTRLVKDNSDATVVWGGIHPTLYPEECISQADVICRGEGEGALSDIIAAIQNGSDYSQIPNLWVNNGSATSRNPLRPLIQELDAIPFPAYARDSFFFIESGKLGREDPTLLDPLLAVLPARGCPFTCSFCVNSLLRPLFQGLGPYLRRRSVRNVIDEIRSVLDLPGHGKNMIEFHDENFGTDPAWLDEFAELYPKEVGLPFKVQYNPKLVSPDILDKLAGCGLHRVKVGIEAGTDEIRNEVFHRPGKNKEIIKLANQIAERKVKARFDLILDNPYDSQQSLEETLELLLQLPKPLRFNLYSLQYFPDYALTVKALEDGHITPAEADRKTLEKRLARNWAFRPSLLPLSRRQMLQNVIWLLAYNLVDPEAVRRALGSGLKSRIRLLSLSLKSVLGGYRQALRRRKQAG